MKIIYCGVVELKEGIDFIIKDNVITLLNSPTVIAIRNLKLDTEQ